MRLFLPPLLVMAVLIGWEQLVESNEILPVADYALLTPLPPKPELTHRLKNARYFRIDPTELRQLHHEQPQQFTLQLPDLPGLPDHIDFDRKQLGQNPVVSTHDGQAEAVDEGVFYRQIEPGEFVAALSVFEGTMTGIIGTEAGNYTLGELTEHPGEYLLYHEDDLIETTEPPVCNTVLPDDFSMPRYEEYHGAGTVSPNRSANDPDDRIVRIHLECDYNLYLNSGGTLQGTYQYVTTLFNFTALIYEVEEVYIQLSEMNVWTVPDPYENSNPLGELGVRLHDAGDAINGDLYHLLQGSLGSSGTAYLDVLCLTTLAPIAHTYVRQENWANFPGYLPSVKIFAHEIGHQIGSPHTHACTWGPSGNQALDNCSSTEGNCPPGPPPADGGTIMSYCSGFNLLNAFGPEPGDLIRFKVATNPCLLTRSYYDQCELDSVLTVVECLPDATPLDPTDNEFIVLLNVQGNDPIGMLTATDLNSGETWTLSFNTDAILGPFPAFEGARTLEIEYIGTGFCTTRRGLLPNPDCYRPDLCAPVQWATATNDDRYETFLGVDAYDDGSAVAAGYVLIAPGSTPGDEHEDLLIMKTGPSGNILWTRHIGDETGQRANSVLALSDGGALVVGTTDAGGGFGTNPNGFVDGFALRLDAAGEEVWRQSYGGTQVDGFNAALALADGDFLLGGFAESSNGDLSGNFGSRDAWVLRINGSGGVVWSQHYGDFQHNEIRSLAPGHNGSFVAAGQRAQPNGSLPRKWAMQFAADGTKDWSQSYPLTHPGVEFAMDIQPLSNGNYMLLSKGRFSYATLLSSSGQYLSETTISRQTSGIVRDAAVLPNGNVAVAGTRYGITGLPGASGNFNHWIVVLDPAGAVVYESSYGPGSYDYTEAVVLLDDGGYLAAGSTAPTGLNHINNNYNAVVLRYGPDVCAQPGMCQLVTQVENLECSDNGTPDLTTDDTYTFNLSVNFNGNCGSGWAGGGQSGDYGTTTSFGPFAIADGQQTLVLSDENQPGQTATLTIVPPNPCSVPPALCMDNLLQNGDFEPWIINWDRNGVVESPDAFMGDYSALLCESSDLLSQGQPVQAGQALSLRFFGKTEDNTGQNEIRLRFLTASFQPIAEGAVSTSVTADSYTAYTLNTTAPAGAAFFNVLVNQYANECLWVDNFELCPDSGDPCSPDLTPPQIAGCPTDISVSTTGNSMPVSWTPPGTTDNCPTPPTMTSSHQPGAVFPIGTSTVTYVATDAAGNQGTCSFLVTVSSVADPCDPDTLPPVLWHCPEDVVLNTIGTTAGATWTPPQFSDNCSSTLTIMSSHLPGSDFPLGTTTVVYTATDEAGNETNCSFQITILSSYAIGTELEPELSPVSGQGGNDSPLKRDSVDFFKDLPILTEELAQIYPKNAEIHAETDLLRVFPNPVHTGELSLSVFSRNSGSYTLVIFNAGGQRVLTRPIQVVAGKQLLKLELKDFSNGSYYLQLRGTDWRGMPVRFVVAR